jgi:4a-hydroxytetrahydrobiopterin dehydratase
LPAPKSLNMIDLANKKCIPCEGDIPSFDIKEIHKYLKMVDGWEVKSENKEVYYLIKDFKFKNFLESKEFVIKVGEIAEKESHHPDIIFGWGYAKIKIYTHSIKGLHESDFVLAAKVDQIFNV